MILPGTSSYAQLLLCYNYAAIKSAAERATFQPSQKSILACVQTGRKEPDPEEKEAHFLSNEQRELWIKMGPSNATRSDLNVERWAEREVHEMYT